MIWSAQRSGGRPLGRRHDEGGMETRMSMAWVPGCRRHMRPRAPRRSLRIVFVSGGCPVRGMVENHNVFELTSLDLKWNI